MQYLVGIPSPMSITARHFAKRAPSARYSGRRPRNPSSPSVIFSPGNPISAFAPSSTLILGTIPCRSSTFVYGVPSAERCRIVSSYRITPLMNSETPGVVNRRSRYARRFSSVDGRSIALNRFSIVGALSSAARIPLPGATRDHATAPSSPISISWFLPSRFSIVLPLLSYSIGWPEIDRGREIRGGTTGRSGDGLLHGAGARLPEVPTAHVSMPLRKSGTGARGGRDRPRPQGDEGPRRKDGDHRVRRPARGGSAPEPGEGPEAPLRHRRNRQGRRDRDPGRPPADDRGGAFPPWLHREAGGRLAYRGVTLIPS